jgi:hypothetical protein
MEVSCACSVFLPWLLSALFVRLVVLARKAPPSNQISASQAATFWNSVQPWMVTKREALLAFRTMPPAWAEGFRDGFTVHDELLAVPRRDRVVCIPSGVTRVQIVRIIKKYTADNPDKAHRATRLIASVALAGAFPCKADLRGLEQNPETKSRWAAMARAGKKVMQFLEGGRYLAVVVDGRCIFTRNLRLGIEPTIHFCGGFARLPDEMRRTRWPNGHCQRPSLHVSLSVEQ